jgi:hypothetical protein
VGRSDVPAPGPGECIQPHTSSNTGGSAVLI